jgi:hypothetical protein
MRKHVLVLTTTAAILACGAIAASAQAPGAQTPGTQQSPTTQATFRALAWEAARMSRTI